MLFLLEVRSCLNESGEVHRGDVDSCDLDSLAGLGFGVREGNEGRVTKAAGEADMEQVNGEVLHENGEAAKETLEHALDVGVVTGELVVGKSIGEGRCDRPAVVPMQAPPSETVKDKGNGNFYGVPMQSASRKKAGNVTLPLAMPGQAVDIDKGFEQALDVGVALGEPVDGKHDRPAVVPKQAPPGEIDKGMATEVEQAIEVEDARISRWADAEDNEPSVTACSLPKPLPLTKANEAKVAKRGKPKRGKLSREQSLGDLAIGMGKSKGMGNGQAASWKKAGKGTLPSAVPRQAKAWKEAGKGGDLDKDIGDT